MQKIIDISHYQTVTSWVAVKSSVDAVIIKATQGHALSSNSYLFTDSKFHEYAKACVKNLIPFGAYHFFTGDTMANAVKEADHFAKQLKPYKNLIIYAVCDAENYNNKWLLGLSREQLTVNINAFCRRMEQHGYVAAHYTNTDHIQSYIDLDAIDYPLWQAHYGGSKPTQGGNKLIAWQYTDKGRVNGICENVDMNHGYIADAEFAIMQLGARGLMNTPLYWRQNYTKLKYLDKLFVSCAARIKKAGKPTATTEAAITSLQRAGIIDTPEYWRNNAAAITHLPELLRNLGGAV